MTIKYEKPKDYTSVIMTIASPLQGIPIMDTKTGTTGNLERIIVPKISNSIRSAFLNSEAIVIYNGFEQKEPLTELIKRYNIFCPDRYVTF